MNIKVRRKYEGRMTNIRKVATVSGRQHCPRQQATYTQDLIYQLRVEAHGVGITHCFLKKSFLREVDVF